MEDEIEEYIESEEYRAVKAMQQEALQAFNATTYKEADTELAKMLLEAGMDVEVDPGLVARFTYSALGLSQAEAEELYSFASGSGPVYDVEFERWHKTHKNIRLQTNVPQPAAPREEDYQAIKEWFLKSDNYRAANKRSRSYPNEESAIGALHLINLLIGEDLAASLTLEVAHDGATWKDNEHKKMFQAAQDKHRAELKKWSNLPSSLSRAFKSSSKGYKVAKEMESLADWAAYVIARWRKEMHPFCRDPGQVCNKDLEQWAEAHGGERRAVLRGVVGLASSLGDAGPTVRQKLGACMQTWMATAHHGKGLSDSSLEYYRAFASYSDTLSSNWNGRLLLNGFGMYAKED